MTSPLSHRHEPNHRLVLSLLRALRHDDGLERLRRPLALLLDAAHAYTREPGGVQVFELCKAAEDITRAITGDPDGASGKRPYAPPTATPLSATDPRVLSMLDAASVQPTLPSPPPEVACTTCDGTGVLEVGEVLAVRLFGPADAGINTCLTCDGAGTIPAPSPPIAASSPPLTAPLTPAVTSNPRLALPCAACEGSGYNVDGTYCHTCFSRGVMSVAEDK